MGQGARLNEYELLYIVSPRLGADEVEQAIESVSGAVREVSGELLALDNWGRRRLAYPIQHHFEGTYVLAKLRLPPDGVDGIERSLRLRQDILRHLLTRGIVDGIEGPPELELTRDASRRGGPRSATAPAAEAAAPPSDEAPTAEAATGSPDTESSDTESPVAATSATESSAAESAAAETPAAESAAAETPAAETQAAAPEVAEQPTAEATDEPAAEASEEAASPDIAEKTGSADDEDGTEVSSPAPAGAE